MSREEVFVSGCVGKQVFVTWVAAQRVARRMRRTQGQTKHVAPYRCRFCGLVHLATIRPVKTKRKERESSRSFLDDYFDDEPLFEVG